MIYEVLYTRQKEFNRSIHSLPAFILVTPFNDKLLFHQCRRTTSACSACSMASVTIFELFSRLCPTTDTLEDSNPCLQPDINLIRQSHELDPQHSVLRSKPNPLPNICFCRISPGFREQSINDCNKYCGQRIGKWAISFTQHQEFLPIRVSYYEREKIRIFATFRY